MVSNKTFRQLALSLDGVYEKPHFERMAFRTTKRIFATLQEEQSTVNVKLSPEDQSVFCLFDSSTIYAVPNKWGQQGWTTINLKLVKKSMLMDALRTAFAAAR
ncbi:MAG: MmcQ/YjbR family DNA-binding protein [Chitinophagaceae bacterium]|nr:MmcQ/YjbR family DNA-binding protein [Chitinophagaceae bacterium]